MNTSQRIKVLSTMVSLLLVAAACGGGSESALETTPTTVPIIEVAGDDQAIKVGVLAIRSAVAANSQYGPIVEYLQDELGRSFELVPLGQDELFEAVEDAEVDFVMSNPLSSVQVQRLYDVRFLATISRTGTGPEFGGLIVVREDSPIEELEDLRDAKVTCVAFETAAGGCNFQVMHLLEAGVTIDEFADFTETPSQDNIVLAVLNGDFDAGFIRTGQLERMVKEGTLLSLDELRVLDVQSDDYVYPHSTRLYPEWPFAALPGTEPELTDAVTRTLLEMATDDPALANANADGFIEPPDYDPLHEMVVELQLRAWDAPQD